MKRKFVIIIMMLAASLSFSVFARQVGQITTQQRADALIRQDAPVRSSRAQVETWLKSRHIKYSYVPKGKFQDYWEARNSTKSINAVSRLIVGYWSDNPSVEVFFFFDGQDKLIQHQVLPSSS